MKAKNYRRIERPYTRNEFIHGAPQTRLAKHDYGVPRSSYEYRVSVVSDMDVQIRDLALESARVTAGKEMSKKLGEDFYLVVKAHPHHVLRENKMIFGAHADRLQEGMSRAFGRPVGRAARVRAGDVVLEAYVMKSGIEAAKHALETAAKKLPKSYRVVASPLEMVGVERADAAA